MRNKKWTDEDELTLKVMVQFERVDKIAERLGRSPRACYDKLKALGVKIRKVRTLDLKHHNTTWTDEEVAYLKKEIKKKTIAQIAEELGRSVSSVGCKLSTEGISVRKTRRYLRTAPRPSDWSWEDVDYLKAHAGRKTSMEIGEAIGKTARAVKIKATRLGISLQQNAWSDEELERLTEMVGQKLKWGVIGKKLKRTPEAVRAKASYIMVTNSPAWSKSELDKLFQLKSEGHTWAQIAKALGRSKSSVNKKYWRSLPSSLD